MRQAAAVHDCIAKKVAGLAVLLWFKAPGAPFFECSEAISFLKPRYGGLRPGCVIQDRHCFHQVRGRENEYVPA